MLGRRRGIGLCGRWAERTGSHINRITVGADSEDAGCQFMRDVAEDMAEESVLDVENER